MAWRIDEHVVRGEIDNRVRGWVTGRIWLAERREPVEVKLEGNPWRDLAGRVLRFTNPRPDPGAKPGVEDFAAVQDGVVGDMTASRKAKVPNCSMEEFREAHKARLPISYHWANTLYLEWFSARNGRVVIETGDYEVDLDSNAAWEMTEPEETEQRLANANALTAFMDRLVAGAGGEGANEGDDIDDEAPQSAAEAEAEQETARMDLLLDRVRARMDREGGDEDSYERIYREERERLRRERGEPEEREPTPEELAEREAWIDEANAAAAEAVAELEAEKWKGDSTPRERRHPLVARCSDLGVRIHQDVNESGWLPEAAQEEHPLVEVMHGAMFAGAKLAGALGLSDGDDEWPPDPLFAGDKLVRLKKARGYLRDAIRGLDAADEEDLAPKGWRAETRREIGEILGEVQGLIAEVRRALSESEE